MLKYSPTLVCIFFSIVILNLIKRSTLKQFLIRLFLWISQQNINCSLYSLWGVGKFNMEEQKPFLTGYWGNLEKKPEALSLIAFYFVAAFCRRNLQSLQERCFLSFSRCKWVWVRLIAETKFNRSDKDFIKPIMLRRKTLSTLFQLTSAHQKCESSPVSLVNNF